MMLANVIFYLDGTPRVWLDAREAELTCWEIFKERKRDIFGDLFGRQMADRQELAILVQSSTESYVSCIQDALALCRKVDEQMTESDKVGHMFKGIGDDAFNLFVCNNVTTVDLIIKECHRFEVAKKLSSASVFAAPKHGCHVNLYRSQCHTTLARECYTHRSPRDEVALLAPFHPLPLDQDTGITPLAVSVIQAVVRPRNC